MNDTYFKELHHILCFIFFDNSLEKENKYNEIYEKYFSENPIRIDRVFLYASYIAEVKNSLYQLYDNNSREAYLSDTFYLLSHSEYFEQNKDLIKGMNDIYKELPIEDLLKNLITEKYKKQPVYNKLLHSLFKEMYLIEGSVKEFCNAFNIDFNKLAKKYNHNYDFEKLMYYIGTGENRPTQPGTNNKTKVKALWKQSKKSLKKLHSLLQNNYNFIDKIDQDIFISHFDGTATPETQKINWIDEQTVFVRLFDTINFCINIKYLHTVDNTVSTAELSKHFTINGAKTDSKKLRQTRNNIKGIDTKKELEIKNISKKIEKTFSTVD